MTAQRVIMMLLLTIVLAVPAAAQDATIPYSLTFFGSSTRGTIGGEWGGMIVEGFYDHGRWVLVSGGQRVVEGTYACGNSCTFDGVLMIYERPSAFRINVPALEETVENVQGRIAVNLTPSTEHSTR